MFWQSRTYKRRVAGWKTGLVGLAILGLIMSGGVALDSAFGVALDGGDRTVILVTLNHPGTLEQHLDRPNPQPKLPKINLSSFGDGNDDNLEEAFFYLPSSMLTSSHKVLTAVSDFKDRRTAVAYLNFGHLKVMPAADAASNTITAFFIFNDKAAPIIWAALVISSGLIQ